MVWSGLYTRVFECGYDGHIAISKFQIIWLYFILIRFDEHNWKFSVFLMITRIIVSQKSFIHCVWTGHWRLFWNEQPVSLSFERFVCILMSFFLEFAQKKVHIQTVYTIYGRTYHNVLNWSRVFRVIYALDDWPWHNKWHRKILTCCTLAVFPTTEKCLRYHCETPSIQQCQQALLYTNAIAYAYTNYFYLRTLFCSGQERNQSILSFAWHTIATCVLHITQESAQCISSENDPKSNFCFQFSK